MTTRYTDQEWSSIIASTENVVKSAITQIPKAVPAFDSPAFAQTIDHTLLKLDATKSQIDELCSEARVAGFASVCVRPNYTQQAVNNVKSTAVKVAVVVGFHTGENSLSEKLVETRHAVEHGATELDVVVNRTHLTAGEYGKVYTELAAIRTAAPHPVLLKLILETSQLNDSQIIAAAVLAHATAFDFIKTSTGFLGHGATVQHVRLMSACCEVLGEPAVGGWAGNGLLSEYKSQVSEIGVAIEQPATLGENGSRTTTTRVRKMQVKASGGIRTLEDAIKMLEAGATRLGSSGGVWIMKEARERAETGTVTSVNKNTSDYVRRSHCHGNDDRGHFHGGHGRANSTNSNTRPTKTLDQDSTRVLASTTRKEDGLPLLQHDSKYHPHSKSSDISIHDFATPGHRPVHSDKQLRHSHQPSPTPRIPLFPIAPTSGGRGHSRRAHGDSDSVLTNCGGVLGNQSQPCINAAHRPRQGSEAGLTLCCPTDRFDSENHQPRSSYQGMQSKDPSPRVASFHLPLTSKHSQIRRQETVHDGRIRPLHATNRSTLNARGQPDWQPSAFLAKATQEIPVNTVEMAHGSYHHKFNLQGDNARGLWDGNGVVLTARPISVQVPSAGDRSSSKHKKVKDVEAKRPGRTRLYTDY